MAIELVLKAILCVEKKAKPPMSHDVYDLWHRTGLPKPNQDDLHRLAWMTEILYWSGRYAAPTKDEPFYKHKALKEKHQRRETLGRLNIFVPTQLGWNEFNSLFEKASDYFWDLEPQNPENYVF
ncbi:hypothetical protein [Martelella mangrovi]|uniref:HEPN domain-containing protein n=1 Tax=Martelella mangrovi TaxID=1397477 RepID=A0ABV2I8J3_9HYPH